MRAVLDVNLILSALLSPRGAPAELLRSWLRARFELIVSPLLLAELSRALGCRKLRSRIPAEDAQRVVEWLQQTATSVADPTTEPPVRSSDPGDDYLLALAASQAAALVSGDDHLLTLRDTGPIFSPASFLALLEQRDQSGA